MSAAGSCGEWIFVHLQPLEAQKTKSFEGSVLSCAGKEHRGNDGIFTVPDAIPELVPEPGEDKVTLKCPLFQCNSISIVQSFKFPICVVNLLL